MAGRPFPEIVPAVRDRFGPVEADLFAARVGRWWPDYTEAAAEVYPARELQELDEDVAEIVARSFARRQPRLRRRDLDRMVRPDWFAEPGEVAYAAYADRFGGDLSGVAAHLGYLRELGVTMLQLRPLQTTRPDPHDGGQAVADHRTIRPDLGTIADLDDLTARAHDMGLAVGVDLVLTHVAREHEWARRARIGRSRYRRAFHLLADAQDVRRVPTANQWATDAPPFTWDDELHAWVRTTFHPWQWDLDWSNSDVFCASLDIMCFLANLGTDVLHLVGLPYVWQRPGSDRRDLPEGHALLQALRAALRIAAPSLVLSAPSAVQGEDPGAYVGRGLRAGREADLAARDDVAVHVLAALATHDARIAARALARPTPNPAGTAWAVPTHDHDEVRWRIHDGDIAPFGLDAAAHRAFLTSYYTGRHPGSPARGLPLRIDPVAPDEDPQAVTGTLAALLGIEAAAELPPGSARDAATDDAVARILLLHAVAYSWGGVPVVWSGDELGLRNDPAWDCDPGRAGDTRWAHRVAMPWGSSAGGERARDRWDPATVPGQVFSGLRHLARVRASLPQLHAAVPGGTVASPHPGVLAVLRRHPESPLLGLYNVTDRTAAIETEWVAGHGVGRTPVDALTAAPARLVEDLVLLPPYAVRWLVES